MEFGNLFTVLQSSFFNLIYVFMLLQIIANLNLQNSSNILENFLGFLRVSDVRIVDV